MPTLVRGMQFTENAWCYLLWHHGWRPAPVPTPSKAPSMWVRCGLDTAESQRDSSRYLERKKNTAKGPDGCVGYDIGGSMYNERLNDQAAELPDAFVLFDWYETMKATFDFATRISPTNPFWPWASPSYPTSGRNDTTLDIAGIAQRVGPNPYAIERSPYWEMLANGVPVHDLPVPPRALWVSPLPEPPLSQGQSGTPTSPLGLRINALQRRCAFEHRWPGSEFNWYYGSDWLRRAVASAAIDLASLGLYDGPLDGREYSVELFTAWDGALHFNYMIGGG